MNRPPSEQTSLYFKLADIPRFLQYCTPSLRPSTASNGMCKVLIIRPNTTLIIRPNTTHRSSTIIFYYTLLYFGMKLYMFRTVPLSIIRRFSLYTQQWYMSYRFADSLRAGSGWNCQRDALISQIYSWNKTLHVSDSSSVHHQEFFTAHTAMVYVIQVC